MTFSGFPQEGLDLLATLDQKDKDWFEANREVYKTSVAEPAKEFVAAMGSSLAASVSPNIVAVPKTNGSIAPINNDLRFSPDASPYKDHLLFRFWEGSNKKTAAMLMIRLSPSDGVGFATGIVFDDLNRWRELIDSDAADELDSAIATLVKTTGAQVVGQALKKVPKPYAPDHQWADLMRHKALQIRWVASEQAPLTSARLVDYCTQELEKCSGVHHWLVDHMV